MTTHQPRLTTYFVIYALLLVGVGATVGASFFHFGTLNLAVMLAIAFAKAALVTLYFMHVRDAPPLTRMAIVAGLVWMAILFAFTLSDYKTRDWIPTREPAWRSPQDPPPDRTSGLD